MVIIGYFWAMAWVAFVGGLAAGSVTHHQVEPKAGTVYQIQIKPNGEYIRTHSIGEVSDERRD